MGWRYEVANEMDNERVGVCYWAIAEGSKRNRYAKISGEKVAADCWVQRCRATHLGRRSSERRR